MEYRLKEIISEIRETGAPSTLRSSSLLFNSIGLWDHVRVFDYFKSTCEEIKRVGIARPGRLGESTVYITKNTALGMRYRLKITDAEEKLQIMSDDPKMPYAFTKRGDTICVFYEDPDGEHWDDDYYGQYHQHGCGFAFGNIDGQFLRGGLTCYVNGLTIDGESRDVEVIAHDHGGVIIHVNQDEKLKETVSWFPDDLKVQLSSDVDLSDILLQMAGVSDDPEERVAELRTLVAQFLTIIGVEPDFAPRDQPKTVHFSTVDSYGYPHLITYEKDGTIRFDVAGVYGEASAGKLDCGIADQYGEYSLHVIAGYGGPSAIVSLGYGD